MEIKAALFKCRRQRLPLEIDWNKSHRLRHSNARGLQPLTLPALRSRVVHLKNAQIRIRITVSKSIEAGAENHTLLDAPLDRTGQLVLGIAAARGQECPKQPCCCALSFAAGE